MKNNYIFEVNNDLLFVETNQAKITFSAYFYEKLRYIKVKAS